MRPRANTISHIDTTSLSYLDATTHSGEKSDGKEAGYGHQSLGTLPGPGGFDYRGMSNAYGHHGTPQMLSKLDTSGLHESVSGGLRTAPPFQSFGSSMDMNHLFASSSTIDPAQLHFSGSLGTPVSSFQNFSTYAGVSGLDEDEGCDWTSGFESQLTFHGLPEQAIDGSSSSAISTASPTGFSEVMTDGPHSAAHIPASTWPHSMPSQTLTGSTPYAIDTMGPVFPNIVSPVNTVSPKDLHERAARSEVYLPTHTPISALSQTSNFSAAPSRYVGAHLVFHSDSPSMASSTIGGSAGHSSATSITSHAITDYTRQALLMSLSQPSAFSHRKNSQHSLSSPLSPGFGSTPPGDIAPFPSTLDLQRYVSSYINYFHPHLPFLHIPTLSFDSPEYTSNVRMPSIHEDYVHVGGIVGGGGCLILSMAAIGALYEYESGPARELFEGAKKMMHLYLEERRKADMSSTVNGSTRGKQQHETPLWLVQAMLLNVIYGHECGDKVAADIASNHCAALVSLARSAELTQPESEPLSLDRSSSGRSDDIEMREADLSGDQNMSASQDGLNLTEEWLRWRRKEERKRTLFAVFILSSLLVTAYNHTPAILNSEIRLDLPCEESLWGADNAHAWAALMGTTAAEQQTLSFAEALTYLLGASQREQSFGRTGSLYPGMPQDYAAESEIRPSTFGCFVLINALHNYIWETRQRHQGRMWTPQETESLYAHVEPALKAWQVAWQANPHHSLERPNPFGPLPADSIPLLDLAYVRLYVNLGRSKEAFWQRDYETMAEELARGTCILQHADSAVSTPERTDSAGGTNRSSGSPDAIGSPADISSGMSSSADSLLASSFIPRQPSRRERQLRKAAFFAADSLLMSDKLGMSFTDFTARELPIQSAMCIFDCAQVLAEWVSTVQERVGRYLGVLGRDDINLTQVPAIILLEDEDCKLLGKISAILASADMKMAMEMNGMASPSAVSTLAALPSAGYGSKLLMVTGYQLEKAAVWPGKHHNSRVDISIS